MRIKKIQLKKFKRFDDLTIDLGNSPKKIIALVGPNGSGKSSVFDAFEEKLRDIKNAQNNPGASFYSKTYFARNPKEIQETYNRSEAIVITPTDPSITFGKKSFYARSPYRFTSRLNIANYKAQPDILEDATRPGSSIDLDQRLTENYERLLALELQEWREGTKSGPEMRQELLGKINSILAEILDIKISNLGDVMKGKGQLFFEKDSSKDFPFENLSSGEKEVVDIIIDLMVKTPEYNDTIYCIDEPELHLNTSIQRKLLIQIDKLIPDSCQLWVATHSIGFLRALQEELKDDSQVFDFFEHDYFNGEKIITPIKRTRANWQRIFQTALEDLTGLLSPKRIIYCEGRQDPSPTIGELGLDADVYNEIFSEEYNDSLFVSSGGGGAVEKNASLALKVLSKAFTDVQLYLLRDRDTNSDADRQCFLDSDQSHRMLIRREIENYLFDKEILKKFCFQKSKTFDEVRYDGKITDINQQDLKPVQQEVQVSCGVSGNPSDFKRDLAKMISSDTQVYKDLSVAIF